MNTATQLLPLKVIAAERGVCVKTVRRWIHEGLEGVRLKARIINGIKIGIRPDDLATWVRAVEKRRFGQ